MKYLLRYFVFFVSFECFAQVVVPNINGTYTTSESRWLITGGYEKARSDALGYAKNFCEQKNSAYFVIEEKRDGVPGFTPLGSQITFTCKPNENAAENENSNKRLAQEIERLKSLVESNGNNPSKPIENQVIKSDEQVNNPQLLESNVPAVSSSRRLALVVGNARYKVHPLSNPKNDADDISKALRSSGFEVIDIRDATLQQMRAAVRQFGDRLINNDVGLVYYSGHGVEVKGRNYFIPVNADIMREDEIADQGLDVSLILEKMNTAGKGVNILIVDACRDDPFGRSFRSSSRGLAQMDAPRGTIIAYATSPGKVASDGDPRERNSPYTKNLVKAMQQPNKPIEQVFKEVRRAVQEETKNQQTPWENTSLSGDFYFKVQR
jgi:hypothetical protein